TSAAPKPTMASMISPAPSHATPHVRPMPIAARMRRSQFVMRAPDLLCDTKYDPTPGGQVKKAAKKSEKFTAEEKAAMKKRVKEMKGPQEGEAVVLAKIAGMKDADRVLAKKIHAIVMAAGPSLTPRLWYGMPAYANQDGKVVCFFQDAAKFKYRYATLGFMDK